MEESESRQKIELVPQACEIHHVDLNGMCISRCMSVQKLYSRVKYERPAFSLIVRHGYKNVHFYWSCADLGERRR